MIAFLDNQYSVARIQWRALCVAKIGAGSMRRNVSSASMKPGTRILELHTLG